MIGRKANFGLKTKAEGLYAAQNASVDWLVAVVGYAQQVQDALGESLGAYGKHSELLRLLRESDDRA